MRVAAFRSLRHPSTVLSRRARRGVVVACLACAVYLLCTYESFTITRISLYDPFGGVTLFPRVRSPCAAPSCEAIVPRPLARDEDKVTVIIMGYKTSRIANYRTLFERYAAMTDTVDQVVFIWNNVDKDPPQVPPGVVLIRAERNDMMNRYTLVHEASRVNAMLTVDDDVLLTEGLLRCMLGKLREHEDSIVGLDVRHVDLETGNYMSQGAGEGPNVVIGKTMLMHRKFHRRASAAAEELRHSTLRGQVCASCDDLVMNAIAGAASGVGPVKMEKRVWPNVLMGLPAPEGVSGKGDWWGPRGRRSQCVRWLMRYFLNATVFHPRAVAHELRCVAPA